MFEYKNENELAAMTPEQRDQYAAAKRTHEVNLTKAQIEAEVNAAKANLKNELESASKAEIDALKETVRIQGEKLAQQEAKSENTPAGTFEDAFKSAYDEVVEGDEAIIANRKTIKIDMQKANLSTDIMSVNTVSAANFPTAGSTGIIGAGLQTLYGKLVGFVGLRKEVSKVMDYVDVMPMDGANLVVINETVTGDAEITGECQLKPIVKVAFDPQNAPASAIAAEWNTTTMLRRFFPALMDRIKKKIAELILDKIPSYVMGVIYSNGTAFTPSSPALAINSNPNNYDALGAVIANQENLGYAVTGIFVNPIDWRNMLQEKTADGIYTTFNGNSIQLLESGINWGGEFIPVIKDRSLAVGNFVVGDLQSVKVGIDAQLLYFETDGRTDAQASTSITGLSRNIRTHVLEKFVAAVIPTSLRPTIIKDTFANVKTLITAES